MSSTAVGLMALLMLATKQPKPKTCKNPACRASFVPQRLGQAVCNYTCGLAIKDVNQEKARKSLAQVERREIKVRKEKLKGRADHAQEAQAVINRYVRLRDAHLGCISCDKPASWGGQWHCSHFRETRWGRRPFALQPLEHEQVLLPVQCPLSGNIIGLQATTGREKSVRRRWSGWSAIRIWFAMRSLA